VNEPRIPINANVRKSEEMVVFSDNPQRMPIAKAPRRFTHKVPHGKPLPKYL